MDEVPEQTYWQLLDLGANPPPASDKMREAVRRFEGYAADSERMTRARLQLLPRWKRWLVTPIRELFRTV